MISKPPADKSRVILPCGPRHIVWNGRKLLYFAGCDYLRVSWRPELSRALAGVRPISAGASRVTTGEHPVYQRLETRLCEFFGTEAALLVSCGYLSNMVAAQGLRGQFTRALVDRKAHPSLQDAARFLDCPILKINHCDPGDLRSKLPAAPSGRALVLTDGLFGLTGKLAPIAEYLTILPPTASVLVDDAHGAGILGANGRGTSEALGISDPRIIQTITLSKAFGAFGGAILGSALVRDRCVRRSHAYAGQTPIPPPLAACALRAVEIVAGKLGARKRLRANVHRLSELIGGANGCIPIFTFTARSETAAETFTRDLLRGGIYPPRLSYPSAPARCFRFAISAGHLTSDINKLAAVILRNRSGLLLRSGMPEQVQKLRPGAGV